MCVSICGSSSPLFDLTGSGRFRTVGSFDATADVDVVVVVATGQVVEAAAGFGEGRQIEREVCGEKEVTLESKQTQQSKRQLSSHFV